MSTTLPDNMPEALKHRLVKQGYHLLGQRGAFKACQWQRKSLMHGDICYKQKFYGIESHRCVQMTPVVDKCTQSCEFCWRVVPSDIGAMWNQTKVSQQDVLPADDLLDEVLMANLRSLGGYNPDAGAAVSKKRYLEARVPKHVAISLAGEPTLYPFLSDLIEEIERRNMSSFLVTNGTNPDVLSSISPPTQLYITLAAPDRETHSHLLKPLIKGAWERLLASQELLQSVGCRTVNRLTMVDGLNMHGIRGYARLIELGEPDFIEVKGYMHLGLSRERLSSRHAPTHSEIKAFSWKISALTGYYLVDEQPESRVVLLAREKNIRRLGDG